MPLLLGQLIYTSFTGVGFKLLASPQVPAASQEAFLEMVVYPRWDTYNPPGLKYRAAYVYQLTSKGCLFGWLYNGGLDDFGRNHVPYFLCYHLAEAPYPSHLEAIFACLNQGPVVLIDRQRYPSELKSIAAPDLWSYQPARPGVAIPLSVRDRAHLALKQGKLLDLFVPANGLSDQQQKLDFSGDAAHQAGDSEADVASLQTMAEAAAVNPMSTADQEYPQKLQQYEREYLNALEHEYPLSDATVLELQRSQQALGLAQTDITLLETQAACQLKAAQNAVQSFQSAESTEEQQVSTYRNFRLGLTAGIAAGVLAAIGIVGLHYEQDWKAAQQIVTIKRLAQARNYSQCSVLAQNVSQDSTRYTTAQELLKQCEAGLNWQSVQTKVLTGHSNSIFFVAFSRDGQTFASGGEDRTIKLWQSETGKLLHNLSGHTDAVRSIAISPDRQTLASGSGDKTIKLWHLGRKQLLHTLVGHSGPVWSIAISPDGQTLASGSYDGTIKLWHLGRKQLLHTLVGHSGPVWSIAISPDGQALASGSGDRTIKLWHLDKGKLLRTLTGHTDTVRSITISPDGQTLASGSWDQTVKLWNLQTGALLRSCSDHTNRVTTVAISPDGQTVASGSLDKTIKIWNLGSGRLVSTLTGHTDWVISVAYNPVADPSVNRLDQQTLASGSKDKTVRLWRQ